MNMSVSILQNVTTVLFVLIIERVDISKFYLTIRPVARKGYNSQYPWGEAEWAIDLWPLRAKGLIVLVSPKSDGKSNNKVSKYKLKKDVFGNKTKEFRYSMTITNSPLVA